MSNKVKGKSAPLSPKRSADEGSGLEKRTEDSESGSTAELLPQPQASKQSVGLNGESEPRLSTPLKQACRRFWLASISLHRLKREAEWGSQGLFASQGSFWSYAAGPEALARDLSEFFAATDRIINEEVALYKRYRDGPPLIDTISRLNEACDSLFQTLEVIGNWERDRRRLPGWNWVFERISAGGGPPVCDYDASDLIGGLYAIVRELAAGGDRSPMPSCKTALDAAAAVDLVRVWCDKRAPKAKNVPDELISLSQVAIICVGLKKKTIENKMSQLRGSCETPPPKPLIAGTGRAEAKYRFSELIGWLAIAFPKVANSLPKDYSEAQHLFSRVPSGDMKS